MARAIWYRWAVLGASGGALALVALVAAVEWYVQVMAP